MSEYGDVLEKMLKILNRIHPMSKDLEKLVTPTMFDQPNTTGFIYLSQYLLSIYDQEQFDQVVQWPLLNKSEEGRYRTQVKSFITTVFEENDDFTMTSVQSSRLHTAHGGQFMDLIIDLTSIVVRKICERKTSTKGLRRPKQWDTLTEIIFKNVTAKIEQDIVAKTERYTDIEKRAITRVEETTECNTKNNERIFKVKADLAEAVSNCDVDEDLKKRLLNIEDKDAIKDIEQDVYSKIEVLRNKVDEKKELVEYAEKVVGLVKSICGQDRVILDGNKLPKVDVEKLSDYPLDPEAKIAVQNLYNDDDHLVLKNWLVVLKAVLGYYADNLNNEEYKPEDNEMITAQLKNLREISYEHSLIQARVRELADRLPKKQLQQRAPEEGRVLNLNSEVENMTEKRLLLTPNTNLPAMFAKTVEAFSPLAAPPPSSAIRDMPIPKLKFDDSIDQSEPGKKSLPPNLMRLFTEPKSNLANLLSTSGLNRKYNLNLSGSFTSKKSSTGKFPSFVSHALDQGDETVKGEKEDKNFEVNDEMMSMADILRKYKVEDTSAIKQ